MLDRATIFGHKTLPTSKVNVPEWGGEVYIRTLTAAEFDAFQHSNWIGEGKDRKFCTKNYRARFVCMVASDDKGVRLFSDFDADEVGQLSGPAVERVFDAGQKHNGLDTNGDALAKNSESGQSAALPSV